MTHEESAKRRAWAATHFGDREVTDAELDTAIYMPSENFSDGWDKGSEYAIRSQWISVDERLPQDKEHIVICYQSYHKGRYLTLYMTDRYEKESGFNGGWIKPEQVIAWMPIPALSLRRTANKNER